MESTSQKKHISIKTVIFIILAVFFVVVDRFLKALSLNGFFDRPIPLIGNILTLNYVKNYYIAFSIPFSGPILTALIGAIILILLIYWIKIVIINYKLSLGLSSGRRQIANYQLYPLTLVIIGAILNFADRIEYGFVIDYFYLKYFTVFNLADCLICGGVIWLACLCFDKNSPKKIEAPSA